MVTLFGVAFATLSLAGGVRAQGSSANCHVSVSAGGQSDSKDVYIKQGFDLANYLCQDDYHNPQELSTYVSSWVGDTAFAWARAYVHSLIDCQVSGSGSVSAYVSGEAEAEAAASATAILEGYASAGTCSGCDVFIDVFIQSTKDVFVQAAAKHEDSAELYVENGEDSVYRDTLIEDVKLEIIDTYVSYVIDLYASMTGDGDDESQYCWVTIDACASTGEDNCCSWSGDAGLYTSVQDAFANAAIVINQEDVDCDSVGDETFHDWATAVARAYAETFGSIYGHCKNANPNGSACIWGSTYADAYVEAAATATASAWIAEGYCGCKPTGDILKKALATVYASAYTSLSAEICVEGVGEVDISVYLAAYEENFVTATADAFASVWQDEYGCQITALELQACAGEAEDNGRCFAPHTGVKHCKSDDHHCVLVTRGRGVCKHVDYEWPGHWKGDILKCSAQ